MTWPKWIKESNEAFAAIVKRAGVRDGVKVWTFVQLWLRAADQLGRTPTIEEYAEASATSRASAFREQALFREVFPEAQTPSDLAEMPQLLGGRKLARKPSVGGRGVAPSS